MKFHTVATSLLIVATGLLSSCNGSGGGTVPAYTSTGKTDTLADKTTEPSLASTGPGRQIFEQRCAPCHGIAGDARKDNSANLQQSRLDSLGIVQTIRNGRGAMPMFKDVLSDSDLMHLAVYVKSLRK